MSPTRRMIKGIPHRPHFYVKIEAEDIAGTIYALESSFEKNGFQNIGSGLFCHREGNVKIRYHEHLRKHPRVSVWCFPGNENAAKSEIEAFAEEVENVIQAVPDVKVHRDDSLLYEKRYAAVRFPDDSFTWVEPSVLWFDDYFKDAVISYITRNMQIDLKNHRRFFETFLARPPDPRSVDKNLDILNGYHYSTIFWLAASRMNLDQLIRMIGITNGKKTQMKDVSFKFKLQAALGAFLTNMCSALDALAQIVNLMYLSKPEKEENVTFGRMIRNWIEMNDIWKGDVSRLRRVFREKNGKTTALRKKCLEMMAYRNIVVHRQLLPLVNTDSGEYFVGGEAGRLIATGIESKSSQSRLIAVHMSNLEAQVDKGLATIVITKPGRVFLPKIREGKLIYDYPIDKSQFNREDVLLQFEKYYECVSSLIEKVYAALLQI